MTFQELNIKQLEANKSSDALSRALDEWDKTITVVDAQLSIVEQAHTEITKEIVKLRNDLAQKRQNQLDLEASISKAHFNLRQLKSEKQQIDRAYWRAK